MLDPFGPALQTISTRHLRFTRSQRCAGGAALSGQTQYGGCHKMEGCGRKRARVGSPTGSVVTTAPHEH